MSSKALTGTVVSTKMNKTVVVEVEFSKIHAVYGRRYKVHSRFKAHYEGSDLKEGDAVSIQQVAPISKSKSWVIVENGKQGVKESK